MRTITVNSTPASSFPTEDRCPCLPNSQVKPYLPEEHYFNTGWHASVLPTIIVYTIAVNNKNLIFVLILSPHVID
jgi:hypothetical protein